MCVFYPLVKDTSALYFHNAYFPLPCCLPLVLGLPFTCPLIVILPRPGPGQYLVQCVCTTTYISLYTLLSVILHLSTYIFYYHYISLPDCNLVRIKALTVLIHCDILITWRNKSRFLEFCYGGGLTGKRISCFFMSQIIRVIFLCYETFF